MRPWTPTHGFPEKALLSAHCYSPAAGKNPPGRSLYSIAAAGHNGKWINEKLEQDLSQEQGLPLSSAGTNDAVAVATSAMKVTWRLIKCIISRRCWV